MPAQWGGGGGGSPSTFLLRGLHSVRPAASPINLDYLYWETDTPGGKLFQSDGSNWIQLLAGITTDVNGSAAVDGHITINNVNATTATEFSALYGSLTVQDTQGTQDNSSSVVKAVQRTNLTHDSNANAGQFLRQGTIGSHEYTKPVVLIGDLTTSAMNLLEAFGLVGGVYARRVTFGKTGGVGMWAKTPPSAQPVGGAAAAGGAYTATEQTMLQAVYDAARAIGLLS